jgi:hypothetical protein
LEQLLPRWHGQRESGRQQASRANVFVGVGGSSLRDRLQAGGVPQVAPGVCLAARDRRRYAERSVDVVFNNHGNSGRPECQIQSNPQRRGRQPSGSESKAEDPRRSEPSASWRTTSATSGRPETPGPIADARISRLSRHLCLKPNEVGEPRRVC